MPVKRPPTRVPAAMRDAVDPFSVPGADQKMISGRAPLKRFKPYPLNARSHPAAEIALLADLIRKHGSDQPIVVDENWIIIKGHGRLQAAAAAGLLDFPFVQRFGLSEVDKRAMRIQDNQVALLAGWSDDLIKQELFSLKAEGYDVELLGFPEIELRGFGVLAGTEGAVDPEAAPEPPADPVSVLGDVWLLGGHRLLCGDATKADDVQRCLAGAKPHLMVTDPPYGVEYDANWRNEAAKKGSIGYGASAISAVHNDDRTDWTEAWKLFSGSVVYCWHAGRHASVVQASLEAAGFEIVCQIIWAKPRFVISRGDYHWRHEPCWYAVRKGRKHFWSGDRSQTTLWEIPHAKSETGHSTQKPIECMKRPIENNSKPGDAVYDPFVGSGTTIIAAEMTRRACRAIEISPAYVDVAVQRWQNFAKQSAILEKTCRSFAETGAERLPAAAPKDGPWNEMWKRPLSPSQRRALQRGKGSTP